MTDRANFSHIIEPVARALLGEPNRKLSNARELRWGSRGSFCVDLQKGVWSDYETGQGGGVLDLITREKGLNGQDRFKWLEEHGFLSPSSKPNGDGRRDNVVATCDYLDENGALLFQVCRFDLKDFRQRRPDPNKPGEWIWSVKGLRQVPYRLPRARREDRARTVGVHRRRRTRRRSALVDRRSNHMQRRRRWQMEARA